MRCYLKQKKRGACVAQSVERPTSAQVMISRSVSLSPASGSVLTGRSLKPALDSVSPSLSAPPPLMLCLSFSQRKKKSWYSWVAWVAQLVERPTSAQVMISRFVSLSPASGSVVTAQSLEPASDSVSPSICPSPAPALSLSRANINTRLKNEKKKRLAQDRTE